MEQKYISALPELAIFYAHSLEGINRTSLMERVDTKYAFHLSLLAKLLNRLQDHYSILEISGQRIFEGEDIHSANSQDFLNQCAVPEDIKLTPSHKTCYSRIALANEKIGERITLDLNIRNHFLLDNSEDAHSLPNLVTAYKNLISTYVNQATVRQYNNTKFTNNVNSLKQLVTTRYNVVSGNSEVNRTGPTISNVQDSVNGQVSVRPSSTQSVNVSAAVSSNSGVRGVNLYYGEGLSGSFTKIAMQANGNSYSATIPAFNKGAFVRYYVFEWLFHHRRRRHFGSLAATHRYRH